MAEHGTDLQFDSTSGIIVVDPEVLEQNETVLELKVVYPDFKSILDGETLNKTQLKNWNSFQIDRQNYSRFTPEEVKLLCDDSENFKLETFLEKRRDPCFNCSSDKIPHQSRLFAMLLLNTYRNAEVFYMFSVQLQTDEALWW